MSASPRWERWHTGSYDDHDDRWADRRHEDHTDQERRGVAGRGDMGVAYRNDSAGDTRLPTKNHQPDTTAELLQAILLELECQRPKPQAPRLKATTPEACGHFVRQWGECVGNGTAVDMGVSVRSCMTNNILATVCIVNGFADHLAPSIRDDELLKCLRFVARPHSRISFVAIYDRLQLAAKSVTPPHHASDVRRHALFTWEAMLDAVTDANCWSMFKDTDDMWGAWKPAAGASFSKVLIEALRPHHFRESVRDELTIDYTPMENPQSFCHRVLHLANQWPEIQRLIDAAVDGNYRCGRGGRGRATGDARDCHGGYATSSASVATRQYYQSDRGHSANCERWDMENTYSGGARNNQMPEYGGGQNREAKEHFDRGQAPSLRYSQFEPPCSFQNPDVRLVQRQDYVGRKAEHRGEIHNAGDTGIRGIRVRGPEIFAGRDHGVRSPGVGAVPSRRAVSPVMRVRARCTESDTLVSHTACDISKTVLDIAAPGLPASSAEMIVTSAVSVPVLVEGVMALEGAEHAKCYFTEGNLATSLETVPELVAGKLGNISVEEALVVEGTEPAKNCAAEGDVATSSEVVAELVEGELQKGTLAVEGAELSTCNTTEDAFATSSDMVPGLVEGELKRGKGAAPTDCGTAIEGELKIGKGAALTDCGTAIDHRETLELVVADEIIDERGKSLSTTMGAKSAYRGPGFVLGLRFGWVLCVAAVIACLVGTTVLLKRNPSRNVWIAVTQGHRFPVTGVG